MIKVVLTQEARGFGGALRFKNANAWRFTEDGTLVVSTTVGGEVLAEVMVQNVLFVEREEYEEKEKES